MQVIYSKDRKKIARVDHIPVEQLAADVDLSSGLSVFGVKSEDFQELSETIAGNFMVPLSPRIAGKDDILDILEAAL